MNVPNCPSCQSQYTYEDGNLFVCPECADLGCGAITAALRSEGDTMTWSDFKHENSYDPSMTTSFPGVGPFAFAIQPYRRVLGETTAK